MGRCRWPFERRVEAWVSALEHNARRAHVIATEYESQREPLRKAAFQAGSWEYRTQLLTIGGLYAPRLLSHGRGAQVYFDRFGGSRSSRVSWWLSARLPFPRVPSPLEIARRVSWYTKKYFGGCRVARRGLERFVGSDSPLDEIGRAYPVLSAAELALWDLCSVATV